MFYSCTLSLTVGRRGANGGAQSRVVNAKSDKLSGCDCHIVLELQKGGVVADGLGVGTSDRNNGLGGNVNADNLGIGVITAWCASLDGDGNCEAVGGPCCSSASTLGAGDGVYAFGSCRVGRGARATEVKGRQGE